MKQIIYVLTLLIAALLLTACAKEASVQETPVEDVTSEEPAAAEIPAETPAVTETPAETEMSFHVKRGDAINYKGKSITVTDIRNYGNLVYLEEDSETLKLENTKNPEIWNNYEYVISEATYNKDQSVTITIKPFVLGADEYLFYKLDKKTISGKLIGVDRVYSDTIGRPIASISVDDTAYDLRLDEPMVISGLEFTLARAFKTSNEYAVLKVAAA